MKKIIAIISLCIGILLLFTYVRSSDSSLSKTKTYSTKAPTSSALPVNTTVTTTAEDTTIIETTEAQPDYVLNTNTMKFHYPDCFSVDRIKDSHRIDYSGDRDTLISLGYSPCKRCYP